jgi:hypothetical protein
VLLEAGFTDVNPRETERHKERVKTWDGGDGKESRTPK